jgi:16S rRNA (guanine1516-N2)-methyltransferase
MIITRGLAVTTSSRAGASEIERARKVASALNSPYIERHSRSVAGVARQWRGPGGIEGVLVVESNRMTLVGLGESGPLGPRLFFHPGMAPGRIKRAAQGKHDHMLEAMGLGHGDRVLDCTLGLGSDAIVAAWAVGLSGKVVGIESSPALAEIVRAGLRDYDKADPDATDAMRRVEVVCAEHLMHLMSCPDRSYDVVYFDPMFREPVRLSPGIAGLRRWASHARLSGNAVREATRVARRRVVIKDRTDGSELDRLGVTARLGGRGSRVEYGVISLAHEAQCQ